MFNRKKRIRNLSSVSRFFGLWLLSILIVSGLAPSSPVRAASVTLSAAPTSRTINQGQSATYTININRVGFAGNVTLNASNLPANATASFNPNPTTDKSSVLTVTTKTTTPTGTFQLKVNGTASGINITSISVTLIIKPAPSVTLSGFPTTQSIIAGQSVSYAINLSRVNYDNPVTLEAQNLPDGLSASFEPNPVYGNSSTMRIYSHLLPFTPRDYQILVSLREFQASSFSPLYLRVNCGLNWAEQFGTSAGGDFARDVVTASDGSIYVTGDNFNPNNNSTDVWVAKYSAGGLPQWFVPFATIAEDHATEIAVDSAGNIFVGGYTAGAFSGNNRGNFDFWIAKFNAQGTQQWISQDGTPDQDGFAGFEIIPDGSGGGKLITSTDERTRISTFTFTGSGMLTQQNSFPLVLDYTVSGSDITDIAVGPNDTVYVVGFLDFGFKSGWVVKYNNQLNRNNRIWSQSVNFGSATRVVVDSSGNAFVSGTFNDTSTGTDAWIGRFNPDFTPNSGNNPVDTNPPVWTAIEASPAEDVINALAINNSGDLIIAGMTQGVLGERNGGGNASNTRFDDAWVERRNGSSGNLKWIRQFPVADIDGFNAVAIASNNDTILAGYTVAFKTNIGFEDALLLRYADNWTLFSPFINGTTPFSPASGRVGATIRINGGNFLGATGVRFNGVPATFTIVSQSAIDAVIPQGATTGTVTVSKDCVSASSSMPFTVLP